MENARIQDKELWILFQDMSKAYDRVNRKLLFKALERIRIPAAFINLLKDALENRSNKILTAVGDTEEYIMTNGIDQGEIISPTLWIIYYNPLFERIKKNQELGYEFKVNRSSKLHPTINISKKIHHIAYMDDTTWIAKNKETMNQQLKPDCRQF